MLVLANLTPKAREVAVAGLHAASVGVMDENEDEFLPDTGKIILGAYVVARLEG